MKQVDENTYFYDLIDGLDCEDEKARAYLVKKLLEKSSPGTDAKWIVNQASILLEYIKPK